MREAADNAWTLEPRGLSEMCRGNLLLASCAIWDKLRGLYVPQFLHLPNGNAGSHTGFVTTKGVSSIKSTDITWH